MDCQRGEVHQMTDAQVAEWEEQNRRRLLPLSEAQVDMMKSMGNKRKKKHMKHQPCPCGSKKKFHKCCWHLYA